MARFYAALWCALMRGEVVCLGAGSPLLTFMLRLRSATPGAVADGCGCGLLVLSGGGERPCVLGVHMWNLMRNFYSNGDLAYTCLHETNVDTFR